MFPATVFVSVASGHLTLLAVGQVLQRSLEPATLGNYSGGGQRVIVVHIVLSVNVVSLDVSVRRIGEYA
ncbi:hypothetical protein GBI51_05695 [Bifidobacterium longum]|nr:hypothetical protein GBJ02_05860 [Bifidobacterium longum]KAB6987969.1 hypothetical protein GBI51_05695 [Bifidobacterium longum]KAB6996713.1 hypothetical protein GBI93_04540 [Bifidobacterium longum]KAB7002741.1 hypothetical protein GBJ05_04895 [Bifidobacterium longum]